LASPSYRSPLAPMTALIRALTAVLLAMPVAFAAAALAGAPRLLLWVGLAVAALYAAIWLWMRPTSFEVAPEGVRIRFPLRALHVASSDVAGARALTSREFLREFGLALRIGAGGLWGGFGWLWTQRRGIVEFYVSRTDRYVLIERRGGRPLLVTPADPEGLVAALELPRSEP
jgi:hypothetical protein